MPANAFAHVCAAIATPFGAHTLAVDLPLLAAHARWLCDNGCDGLVLFGTTGEAASLSAGEKSAVLQHLIDAGIPARSLLVGVSGCAIPEVIELTRYAARLCCAGALLMPPFFFKAVSPQGAARFYDEVIAGCGTELPPLYLYHIPQNSGVPVDAALTARLLEHHGERIRGYKDSSGQWANTTEILRSFPQLEVFVGSEVFLLDTLRAGGAGCISASVNVQPAAVRRVYDEWRCARADALQAHASAVRRTLEGAGPIISATKTALAGIHREPAWALPRPPLDALGGEASAALIERLRALGVAGLAAAAPGL